MTTLAPSPVAPTSAPATFPDAFEVFVTDEDLLLGARAEPEACAIARACTRTLALRGIAVSSYVDYGIAYFEIEDGTAQRYGHDADPWVRTFDQGYPVEPRSVRFYRLAPLGHRELPASPAGGTSP